MNCKYNLNRALGGNLSKQYKKVLAGEVKKLKMSEILGKTLNCQILYHFNLTFFIFIVVRNRQPNMYVSIYVQGCIARYAGEN